MPTLKTHVNEGQKFLRYRAPALMSRRRLGRTGLILVVFYVIVGFVAGENGLLTWLALNGAVQDKRTEVARLESEITTEEDRLERVRNDPHEIEVVARVEFDYTPPNAEIYVFEK